MKIRNAATPKATVTEDELITRKNYVVLCLDVNPVFIVGSYGLFGLRFGAAVGCLILISKKSTHRCRINIFHTLNKRCFVITGEKLVEKFTTGTTISRLQTRQVCPIF